MEWQQGEFTISDAHDRLDLAVIAGFIGRSYWAEGVPEAVVRKSVANSLCFGVFHDSRQIGFARAITDRATFAYLADVFVLEQYRGRGLGKWLVSCIRAHPELQGLRRWMLATRDAHGLYREYGFTALNSPERMMEIHDPDIYRREA